VTFGEPHAALGSVASLNCDILDGKLALLARLPHMPCGGLSWHW
jgi:hypothetical protein